ncbi:WD repeat-containing protein 89-like [Clytia hemisphaerica]|uniref:WD repeat-containing protein 89 n=1 Tax=Clytia hemisphaerica TaxID=252671 RepID=A0A7M5U9H9_9CNID|eukprot:TCONS_00009385-protein
MEEFKQLKLARSCAVSLASDPVYVMKFAAQHQKDKELGLFAVAVSANNEIKLYDQDTFCTKGCLLGHEAGLSIIKFDILHPKYLWSASNDGTIRLWDTEKKEDNVSIVSKCDVGYASMDINCDGSILAAATERHEEQLTIKLEFWDIRKIDEKAPKLLATFEEVHSDDITILKFHPTNSKILATGSTDGLVTILDLTTFEEEDALVQTLNTESSVNSIGFFGPSFEYMYALTHIETIIIWKYMEGDVLTSIIDLREKSPKSVDYVIDCHYHEVSQRLFLICGTHRGKMEVLHINLENVEAFQTMCGGHSSTIRCIHFSNNGLLTGAEDGMICSWSFVKDGEGAPTVQTKSKAKTPNSKKAKKRSKPYKANT